MINGIEITDVIIFPVKKRAECQTVLGFARIVINDQFLLSGVRIHQGEHGNYISFPDEIVNGKSMDIYFLTTNELREYMQDEILKQYQITMDAYKS